MSRALILGCSFILATASSRSPLVAQTAVRFIGADMYGGVVLPADTDPGFSFGARVGLLEFEGASIRVGPVIDWWAAERPEMQLEVRDIVFGLDVWKEIGTGWLHPFFGFGAAIHSLDVSPISNGDFAGRPPLEALILEGVRVGASGFAGAALRLTATGAIWSVLEYRYNLVERLANHEIRLGLRLLVRGA